MYLISACLAGHPVRYDAKSYLYPVLQELISSGKAISACPEMLGHLPCPRHPAEIIGGSALDVLLGKAKVVDCFGTDLSSAFIDGAYKTLKIAQKHGVKTAVLKEFSPSCGRHFIYDGTFNKQKISGFGVTAVLLIQHGIDVISEQEFFERL